jgi:DNA-binding GntR family transcriptional regulator
MRRLHSEGLIKIIPNRGAFVASWNEADIDQYFDVVVLLESHTTELAAGQITEESIAILRGLAEDMWTLVKTVPILIEQIKTNNDLFHMTIWAACGNQRLGSVLRSMVEVEYVLGTFQRYNKEDLIRSAYQHSELVVALEAHDAAWARSVMATHLLSARHALMRSIQRP